MSSEMFENDKMEVQDTLAKIRKLMSQARNFRGEQRDEAMRQINKLVSEAEELLYDMDSEVRNAPSSVRHGMNRTITELQKELQRVKEAVKSSQTRSDLFGGANDGYQQSREYSGRQHLLEANEVLQTTGSRIDRMQQIGEESEQIGHGTLGELHRQREVIVSVGQEVRGIDANMSRAKRLLDGMARRVMTNKMIMITIIVLELGIIVLIVLLKFIKV